MSQNVVEKTADYIAESAQQAARKTSEIADAIEEGAVVVKRAAKHSGDAAGEFINDVTKLVQHNVLATIAATLVAGVASGVVIGWMIKRR